jgi:hypothetical protein
VLSICGNVMSRYGNMMSRHGNVISRYCNVISRYDNVMSICGNVMSRYAPYVTMQFKMFKTSCSELGIINHKPFSADCWRWYITFKLIYCLDIFLCYVWNKIQNSMFRRHYRFPSTYNRASEASTNFGPREKFPKLLGNRCRWIAYQGIRLATVGCLADQRFDLVFTHVHRIHRSHSHKVPVISCSQHRRIEMMLQWLVQWKDWKGFITGNNVTSLLECIALTWWQDYHLGWVPNDGNKG